MSRDTNVKQTRRNPPAKTLDARENQLISMAIDMAEEQIINRTAKSSTLNHFLQLGTVRAQLDKDILREEIELKRAKTEAIKSQKRVEELYSKALDAMRIYSGAEPMLDED